MAAFIKFFGSDNAREALTYSIKAEIKRAECHKVAGFSEKRPPTNFNPEDIIYMGRMVNDDNLDPKNDYIIFGKGVVADSFKLPRDKATLKDTMRLPFRSQWPLYLQLKDTVFIKGTLRSGILIEAIIKQFQYNSFHKTLAWYNSGKRNFSIRTAFSNQSYIELTKEASEWVDQKFRERIRNFGQVEQEYLNSLSKPDNS